MCNQLNMIVKYFGQHILDTSFPYRDLSWKLWGCLIVHVLIQQSMSSGFVYDHKLLSHIYFANNIRKA